VNVTVDFTAISPGQSVSDEQELLMRLVQVTALGWVMSVKTMQLPPELRAQMQKRMSIAHCRTMCSPDPWTVAVLRDALTAPTYVVEPFVYDTQPSDIVILGPVHSAADVSDRQ
jgi:hypothetical protein